MGQDNVKVMADSSESSGQSFGAGISGLVGFSGFFALAILLFVTENFFGSLLSVSFALLFYVAGRDMGKIILSSFTMFFSSRHLRSGATYLEETLEALKKSLKYSLKNSGQDAVLPNNPLTVDIQKLINEGKDFDYIEYTAHSYYVECHELYDFASSNLDFVAVSMPIFGLIGTIIGLMSMFDNLGGDITMDVLSPQLAMALKTTLYGALFSAVYKILGSRFERRIATLDYNYETLCRALQVVLENKIKIEIGK